jgi:hypothetical protein
MLTTYQRSWALIVLIIVFKFLLIFYLLLLEVIGANNLGTFTFKAHLKSTQELLPLGAITFVPPFEQTIRKGTYCLHQNIPKRFHDHSFMNIISNLPYDSHQAHLM